MIFLGNPPSPSLFKYLVILFIGGLILWRISLVLKYFSFPETEKSKKRKRFRLSPMRRFIEKNDLDRYWLKENRWNSALLAATSMRIKAMVLFFILSIIAAILGAIFRENNVLAGLSFGTMVAFIINAFIFFKIIFQYYFVPDFRYILRGLYFGGRRDGATKAIDNFRKAIEIKPREFTYSQLAQIIFRQEFSNAQKSGVPANYDESIDLYNKAIEVSPYDISILLRDVIHPLTRSLDFEGVLEKRKLYKEIYVNYEKKQNLLYRLIYNFFFHEKKKKQRHYNDNHALLGMGFYHQWAESLFKAGDYEEAFNKINIAMENGRFLKHDHDLSELGQLKGKINSKLSK